MSKNKHIRLIGKRAVFNAEIWARAVEALARQLQREAQSSDATGDPQAAAPKPEAGS
jgi:hypothetical protein